MVQPTGTTCRASTKVGPFVVSCGLGGAELGAEILFKSRDNSGREIVGLCIGQRGFAALESDADKERVFSCGDIFAAEEIGCFDGGDFGDVERADRFDDVGKRSAVGEEQGEISLDGGETREWLVTARFF